MCHIYVLCEFTYTVMHVNIYIICKCKEITAFSPLSAGKTGAQNGMLMLNWENLNDSLAVDSPCPHSHLGKLPPGPASS